MAFRERLCEYELGGPRSPDSLPATTATARAGRYAGRNPEPSETAVRAQSLPLKVRPKIL